MTEVLVSDLGQVLVPFSFDPTKRFLRERCGAKPDGDPWERLVRLHDRMGYGIGACDSPAFLSALSDALGFDAADPAFCAAWCDVFTEDTATVALIARARVARRYMLSNTNDLHWKWIQERFPGALAFFDGLLVSHELGLEKPHHAIYRRVEEITGYPPEAHLLVDDMAANVEGARACGWDGIVHTDAAALEEALRSRGLL